MIQDISIHAPCVGSDLHISVKRGGEMISIHAPCVGSDLVGEMVRLRGTDFNPRSLCGERRPANFPDCLRVKISIHAPCVGSDIFSLSSNPCG